MVTLVQYYWRLLDRSKFLILGIFVLVNGISLMGLMLQKPVYQAHMRIVYNAQLPQVALNAQSLFGQQNSEINNQLEILRSYILSNEALNLWKLNNQHLLITPDQFYEGVEINTVGGTSLIDVSFKQTSPANAVTGLGYFLKAYQNKDREIYHQNLDSTRKVLDESIAQLEKKLIHLGKDLARYKKDSSVVANSKEVYGQMLEWQRTKQEHEYLSNSAKQQLHQMHDYLNGQTNLVKVYKRIDQHPIIYKLLKDKEVLLAQGARHQKIRDAEININKNILKIVAQKNSGWYDQYHSYLNDYYTMRSEYDSRRAKYNALAEIINRYGGVLEDGSAKVWQFNKLDRTNEVNMGVYANLLKQREELAIQRANDPGNIRLVEKPYVSALPIFPKIKQTLMLSLALSIILIAAAVVGLEMINPTIAGGDQIQSLLKLKSLVNFSAFARDAIISNADEHSPYSEAIRKLRIYLNALLPSDKKNMVIGVVRFQEGLHPLPNSVAYNLGIFMAYTGQQTLLVETDYKNPSMSKYFAPSPSRSLHLAKILKSKTVPIEVIRKTSIPDFSILNFEVAEMHSADVWEIPNVRNWIKLLKKSYMTQLILTPPANLVPYALTLLDYFDKIVLEIPQGFRDVAAIEEFKAVAQRKEVEIIGAYLV